MSHTMRVRLFGVEFENATLKDATASIVTAALERRGGLVVTANVDHIVTLQRDEEMRRIYERAAFRFADGMPIVWLSRLVHQPGLVERVTGADLLISIAEAAARKGVSLFLLGGRPGAASKAAEVLQARFPGLPIAGTYCPPFGFEQDPDESAKIAEMIRRSKADILFVGVGAPKQEKWIHRWLPELGVGMALGVGAAIEFAAGVTRRAPKLVQQCGFEWAWRLASDPKRLWRRYLVKDSRFLLLAFQELRRARAATRVPPLPYFPDRADVPDGD